MVRLTTLALCLALAAVSARAALPSAASFCGAPAKPAPGSWSVVANATAEQEYFINLAVESYVEGGKTIPCSDYELDPLITCQQVVSGGINYKFLFEVVCPKSSVVLQAQVFAPASYDDPTVSSVSLYSAPSPSPKSPPTSASPPPKASASPPPKATPSPPPKPKRF